MEKDNTLEKLAAYDLEAPLKVEIVFDDSDEEYEPVDIKLEVNDGETSNKSLLKSEEFVSNCKVDVNSLSKPNEDKSSNRLPSLEDCVSNYVVNINPNARQIFVSYNSQDLENSNTSNTQREYIQKPAIQYQEPNKDIFIPPQKNIPHNTSNNPLETRSVNSNNSKKRAKCRTETEAENIKNKTGFKKGRGGTNLFPESLGEKQYTDETQNQRDENSAVHTGTVNNSTERNQTPSNVGSLIRRNTSDSYIIDLLDAVSKHLNFILEAYDRYMKIKTKFAHQPESIERSRKYFLMVKYHFFQLSYETVATVILPEENNKTFIDTFLKRTMTFSNTSILNDVWLIFVELLNWARKKKQGIREIPLSNLDDSGQEYARITPLLSYKVPVINKNPANANENPGNDAFRNHPPAQFVGEVPDCMKMPESQANMNYAATASTRIGILHVNHSQKSQTQPHNFNFLPNINCTDGENLAFCQEQLYGHFHLRQLLGTPNGKNVCDTQQSLNCGRVPVITDKNGAPLHQHEILRVNSHMNIPQNFNNANQMPKSFRPATNMAAPHSNFDRRQMNPANVNIVHQVPPPSYSESTDQTSVFMPQDQAETTGRSVSTDSGIMSPPPFHTSPDPQMVFAGDHQENLTPVITHVTSLNPKAPRLKDSPCHVCRRITNIMCLGCYGIYYCSNHCQKVDWLSHREHCKPCVNHQTNQTPENCF